LLYILCGEDDFSLRQELEKIKSGIGDETALATNTTVLEGPQVTVDQLRMAAETVPFLAEKRLVIIHGLLERIEPKAKSSRRKKADGTPALRSDYKPLSDCLANLPETAVVVLVDGKIKGSNPLLGELKDRAKIMSFPILQRDRLKEWIQKRVVERGGAISPSAIALLRELVGGNLWVMASEIDKLVAFAAGRLIEEEDVRRVVSSFQEASVFNLIDATCEFRIGKAEKLLQQLLQQGASPAYLLVMLTRQLRGMVRAKELRGQLKSEGEMMRQLDMGEYALRRTLEQAGRYSPERLREFYHRLLETDLAIKRGRYNAELALNILVAELCQRQKQPA
jgi:DNA polymerase-3 subunit delta